MTQLPATLIEAELLAFGRIFIARVREGAFLDSPHGALDPAAAHWFVRRIIKQYAESHPLNAARMVEAAVLGWSEAQTRREVEHYLARVEAERLSQEQPDDHTADTARLGAPEIVPLA